MGGNMKICSPGAFGTSIGFDQSGTRGLGGASDSLNLRPLASWRMDWTGARTRA
jgi:hypothetical protein